MCCVLSPKRLEARLYVIRGLAASGKGIPWSQATQQETGLLCGDEQADTKNTQAEAGSPPSRDVRMGLPYVLQGAGIARSYRAFPLSHTTTAVSLSFYPGVEKITNVSNVVTALGTWQRDSAMHIGVSTLPKLPAHPGCHITLSRVPCVLQYRCITE